MDSSDFDIRISNFPKKGWHHGFKVADVRGLKRGLTLMRISSLASWHLPGHWGRDFSFVKQKSFSTKNKAVLHKMNTPTHTKHCVRCGVQVETKTVGQRVCCAKCDFVISEVPLGSAQHEPTRRIGFGTEVTRTPRRNIGWG